MKLTINGVEKRIQIAPTYSETLNETFDTLSFILEINSDAEPYAPQSKIVLFDDNNAIIGNFVLTNDEVEVVGVKPTKYRHTITATQDIEKMNKDYVKDMKFSQPAKSKKRNYLGYCFDYDSSTRTYTQDITHFVNDRITISLNAHENIKSIKIKKTTTVMSDSLANNTFPDKESLKSGGSATIWYRVLNAFNYSSQEQQITINDGEFQIINQLITHGSNAMEVWVGMEELVSATGVSDTKHNVQVRLEVEVETYYYTLFDILSEIKKSYNQVYWWHSESSTEPFKLPTISHHRDLYNILTSTVAPEITIQQATIYQAIDEVAKVLDGVWKIDETTGELDIEYFNDNSEANEFDENIANVHTTIKDDNYVNNMLCQLSNGRTNDENLKWTPSKTQYKRPQGASYGKFDTENLVLLLDGTIESIEKMEVLIPAIILGQGNNRFFQLNNYPLDITKFVVSSDEYTTLTYSTAEPTDEYLFTLATNNTIYYNSGSNQVVVGDKKTNLIGISFFTLEYAIKSAIANEWGMITTAGSHWTIGLSGFNIINAGFRVAYKTSIDGRVKTQGLENKYNGSILSNQGSSQPSVDKLGQNMFGLALKLGQPEKNIEQSFTTFANRIKKGDIRTIDGDLWRADTVITTIYNDHVECKATFVKNFNKLSNRVEVNSQKRFYEVQKEIISEDNLVEYMAFSLTNYDIEGGEIANLKTYGSYTCLTTDFNNAFQRNFKYNSVQRKIESAQFFGNGNNTLLYIPMQSYGFSNTMVFRTAFESPISAGYRVDEDPYRNTVVKYTDANGFFDNFIINYVYSNLGENNILTSYPVLNVESTDYTSLIQVSDYQFHKRPNEIFAFNFQLTFIPEQQYIHDLFIGNSLSVRNTLIIDREKTFKLYYSSSYKYSIYDKKGQGTLISSPDVVISTLSAYSSVSQVLFRDIEQISHTSWALCDENGDIIIAANSTDNQFCYYPTGRDRPM